MVGTEVDERQPVEVDAHKDEGKHLGIECHYPLVVYEQQPGNAARPEGYKCSGGQQHHILPEGLPVGEFPRITEASAIGRSIRHSQIEGDGREHQHQSQHDTGSHPAVDTKKHAYAQIELQQGQTHGQQQRHHLGHPLSQAHELQIVGNFVLGARRIDELHNTGQHERDSYQQSASVDQQPFTAAPPLAIARYRHR